MGISRRLLAILPLIALAIAGCGGGDGGDSTAAAPVETTEATTALSKEELIAQGDAICAEVNAAVGTVGSTSSGATGQAAQVADLYSGMVERLKGLGTPSDDSAGYAEFISAAEALAQAEDDVKLASERGRRGRPDERRSGSLLGAGLLPVGGERLRLRRLRRSARGAGAERRRRSGRRRSLRRSRRRSRRSRARRRSRSRARSRRRRRGRRRAAKRRRRRPAAARAAAATGGIGPGGRPAADHRRRRRSRLSGGYQPAFSTRSGS